MKVALLALLFFLSQFMFSQNLVSPIWKIGNYEPNNFNIQNLSTETWSEVNLLLSWERQGYSWLDEQCVLTNSFLVGENNTGYSLIFSLQCNVEAIYLNNEKIGEGIPNSFWSDREKKTSIKIPAEILQPNKQNRITFVANGLSYTGGLSHNYCYIQNTKNAVSSSFLELVFPNPDHVFLDESNQAFNLAVQSSHSGEISLVVKNDFHEIFINAKYKIQKGENNFVIQLADFDFKPGFYECAAILNNGTYIGDVAWFAIQPENIACNNDTVAGFDAYWQLAITELKTIDPMFKMHKVDSLCSKNREGYVVEMQSLGDLTIRGYYFVPKSQGKHPVVLHVPGYGYGFNYVDGFKNREGNVAELAICVRGHGISADVFNPWPDQTLWSVNACSKQNHVYRSLYMDCLRAVDFLLTRPEIDEAKIAVVGGSQGGGLSLMTAGLYNDKIAACAFYDPFLCDTRDQIQIRKMVKHELLKFTDIKGNNCDLNQILLVQDFMDTKGFASKIKCPVYFSAGLFDDDCPVHAGFSAYNLIQSVKHYKVYPNDSHLGESNQYDLLFYEAMRLME